MLKLFLEEMCISEIVIYVLLILLCYISKKIHDIHEIVNDQYIQIAILEALKVPKNVLL